MILYKLLKLWYSKVCHVHATPTHSCFSFLCHLVFLTILPQIFSIPCHFTMYVFLFRCLYSIWVSWTAGWLMDQAEYVAMVLPGMFCNWGSKQAVCQQEIIRGGLEDGVVYFCMRQRFSNFINTHTPTNSHGHLKKCMHRMHTEIHASAFLSVELNLIAARDTAVELFMAARLQTQQ